MAVDDNRILEEIALFMGAIKGMLSGPDGVTFSNARKGAGHDNPKVKEAMAHDGGLALVTKMFAMRDEHLSDATRQEFEALLEPDEKQRYEALLHVRNTYGHATGGSRARNRRDDFDAVMSGPKPFTGVVSHDADTMLVNTNIVLDCNQFLREITEAVFRRFSQQMRGPTEEEQES